MQRRIVLMLALAATFIFGAVARAANRPNVLLIMADDQTWEDSGVYGNDEVHTPNIDQLAKQGMRFTYCFTATAMCAPTRQQLYTGIFPVKNGAYPNHSKVKPGTKSLVHHLSALGYRVGLSGKRHIGPKESFPFETVKDIKAFIEQDKSQPYCLIVASDSPHLPWSAGDASRYNADKLTLPPYFVDTPETRTALTKYYAEITDFDRELGQCMKFVQQSGQADNTIFIYTSEQGAQFPRCKWTCYDTGVRTALIVRWPGRVKAGSVSDAMVQYVDVVPTLIAAAGGEPIDGLDGRSFLPVLEGKSHKHADVVFGVHTTRGIIDGSPSYPIRSIRTRTHKLVWNLQYDKPFLNILQAGRDRSGYWGSWVTKAEAGDGHAKRTVKHYRWRPQFEFYDLRNDRYELNNLADDPKYRNQIADLHDRLKAWMASQGDKGIETELAANKRDKKRNNKAQPKQPKPKQYSERQL